MCGYCRALAIAAARCSAVGFSAVQLTHRPSAVMASCVVGPMAASWKQRTEATKTFQTLQIHTLQVFCAYEYEEPAP